MTGKRVNNAGTSGTAQGEKRESQGVPSSESNAKVQRTGKSYNPDKRLEKIIGGSEKFNVYDNYSCTLNLTDIWENNNKFYLMQLIEVSRKVDPYICYTRWGRVGEEGQFKCENCSDVDKAIKFFCRKFKSKTGNDWNSRSTFYNASKYVLLEMADEVDPADPAAELKHRVVPESKLDYRTQIMINLIFSDEMFLYNMKGMHLDVKKMALGKLSKVQIEKGIECLLDIEKAIKDGKNIEMLKFLSSKYYTVIPHAFGRNVPPIMFNQDFVNKKKENMMTLMDIELTQSLQDDKMNETINETDEKYDKLKCDLVWLPKNSEDYKMIENYVEAGKLQGSLQKSNLLDIWRVDREGEFERFNAHNDIEHRKLLWYGTNIAGIVAILKAGFRITPYSGFLGRGIHFASEMSRCCHSVTYFGGEFENENRVCFLFLVEVPLGRVKEVSDYSYYTAASPPKGYDSIVARGKTEPDEKQNLIKKFENHDVIIPCGPPIIQKKFENSSFRQSTYLIYKESQARIRYLLKFTC